MSGIQTRPAIQDPMNERLASLLSLNEAVFNGNFALGLVRLETLATHLTLPCTLNLLRKSIESSDTSSEEFALRLLNYLEIGHIKIITPPGTGSPFYDPFSALANTRLANPAQDTLLHCAVRSGKFRLIEKLTSFMDASVSNLQGETPFSMAVALGYINDNSVVENTLMREAEAASAVLAALPALEDLAQPVDPIPALPDFDPAQLRNFLTTPHSPYEIPSMTPAAVQPSTTPTTFPSDQIVPFTPKLSVSDLATPQPSASAAPLAVHPIESSEVPAKRLKKTELPPQQFFPDAKRSLRKAISQLAQDVQQDVQNPNDDIRQNAILIKFHAFLAQPTTSISSTGRILLSRIAYDCAVASMQYAQSSASLNKKPYLKQALVLFSLYGRLFKQASDEDIAREIHSKMSIFADLLSKAPNAHSVSGLADYRALIDECVNQYTAEIRKELEQLANQPTEELVHKRHGLSYN